MQNKLSQMRSPIPPRVLWRDGHPQIGWLWARSLATWVKNGLIFAVPLVPASECVLLPGAVVTRGQRSQIGKKQPLPHRISLTSVLCLRTFRR